MQVTDINTLNLNDSEIIEFKLNDKNEIEILVNLIVDYQSQDTKPHKITFSECRSANLDLNLGYLKPGSILKGEQKMVDDGFIDYKIETNTTASIIQISARKLSLEVL